MKLEGKRFTRQIGRVLLKNLIGTPLQQLILITQCLKNNKNKLCNGDFNWKDIGTSYTDNIVLFTCSMLKLFLLSSKHSCKRISNSAKQTVIIITKVQRTDLHSFKKYSGIALKITIDPELATFLAKYRLVLADLLFRFPHQFPNCRFKVGPHLYEAAPNDSLCLASGAISQECGPFSRQGEQNSPLLKLYQCGPTFRPRSRNLN